MLLKGARVDHPPLLIHGQLLWSAHGLGAPQDGEAVASPPLDDVVDGLRLHTREAEHLLNRSHHLVFVNYGAEPKVDHEFLLRDSGPWAEDQSFLLNRLARQLFRHPSLARQELEHVAGGVVVELLALLLDESVAYVRVAYLALLRAPGGHRDLFVGYKY